MSWLEDLIPGPVVAVSSDYPVPECNGIVVAVTDASDTINITLPLAPILGQLVIVKSLLSSVSPPAITIAGNGQTIDGVSSYSLLAPLGSVGLVYTGSGWGVLWTYGSIPVG